MTCTDDGRQPTTGPKPNSLDIYHIVGMFNSDTRFFFVSGAGTEYSYLPLGDEELTLIENTLEYLNIAEFCLSICEVLRITSICANINIVGT